MKDNIYSTVCPGCGMGCGVYIREDSRGTLNIDYMKSSPVNHGKLCRFGMKLHNFYSSAYTEEKISQLNIDNLIENAANRLKKADKIAMISVGNTTCEEQLAFMKLAQTLNTSVNGGIQIYNDIIDLKCHSYLESIKLNDVESAKKIILFIDPYLQYPLLVRRLLIAKNQGAHIISVGTKKLHLADENLSLNSDDYTNLELDQNCLIITDIHPYSKYDTFKNVLNLSLKTGAKLLLMKPFVNSEGVNLLSVDKSNYLGLEETIKEIDNGNIKNLILLDTDLIELMLDPSHVIKSLKKLDNLIVFSSRESLITKLADIVIPTEPLYKKAGCFINTTADIQYNEGGSINGINYISYLDKMLGGNGFDFKYLQNQVELIMTAPKEKSKCESYEFILQKNKPINELKYIFNPFMWFNQPDDNDFVMINGQMIKDFNLHKGTQINLSSTSGEISIPYRVENIPKGQILSCKKLSIATKPSTEIEVR